MQSKDGMSCALVIQTCAKVAALLFDSQYYFLKFRVDRRLALATEEIYLDRRYSAFGL